MEKIKLAVLVPERNGSGVADQALGARLAARYEEAGRSILAEEIRFNPEDSTDLERKVAPLRETSAGMIGATSVPESAALGALAEKYRLLCFVANNNPSVWNGKRHVFHIGIPSAQTAEAVAAHLAKAGILSVRLVHDRTEFQRRAAAAARAALQRAGLELTGESDGETGKGAPREPDLCYLLYSDEERALAAARSLRRREAGAPILFGRSLLRRSFIDSLGEEIPEAWFVDLFPRTARGSPAQHALTESVSGAAGGIPTANHCFGWDAMAIACRALREAGGDPGAAVGHLESGVVLEGVAGSYRFDAGDHNGRAGGGPTFLSRWRRGRLEEISGGG